MSGAVRAGRNLTRETAGMSFGGQDPRRQHQFLNGAEVFGPFEGGQFAVCSLCVHVLCDSLLARVLCHCANPQTLRDEPGALTDAWSDHLPATHAANPTIIANSKDSTIAGT